MDGRYAASFADIQAVAKPSLRHRIMRSFEAEADGIDTDWIIEQLLERIPADLEHASLPPCVLSAFPL